MDTPYAIEMLHITKRFPGIIANDDITLRVKKGEIHALLGENGAGKSTLMSVLFGLYQPEEGTIKKDGKVVSYKCSDCGTVASIYKTYAAAKASGLKNVEAFVNDDGETIYLAYTDGKTDTTKPADGTSSPKTFDAGIAMYVGMALTSVAGSAVVIGKKKEF